MSFSSRLRRNSAIRWILVGTALAASLTIHLWVLGVFDGGGNIAGSRLERRRSAAYSASRCRPRRDPTKGRIGNGAGASQDTWSWIRATEEDDDGDRKWRGESATRKTAPEDIVSPDLLSRFETGIRSRSWEWMSTIRSCSRPAWRFCTSNLGDGRGTQVLSGREGTAYLRRGKWTKYEGNTGRSILFFGDIVRRARRIRGVGLDPGVVNAGILVGRQAIVTMVNILKENGIDSNIIRRKSIKFRFDNDTGNISLVSIRQFSNSDSS